ncbi:HD family phosphohydrolase [Lentibacillus amyloliquefaciens]|uniref:HD domain-containing protein n=1 Tax=Lentibacillus amyloliquefaciens TaxID=1472767 RepID=A0A0U4FQJ5_9BACI|nr:HDIG domain-containing metalloprotein [Lentibacillus amyloliquefaciens]ALX48117.1 hypothetical protein AOX59_05570 [Lentibacillus amyloliquefaciens]
MKWLRNMIRLSKNVWANKVMVLLTVSLLGAAFFITAIGNVQPETYEIERFSIAPETIRSPVTIENEEETERKIREVVQSVEDRFNVSNDITDEQTAYIEEVFDAVVTMKQSQRPNDVSRTLDEDTTEPLTSEEQLAQLKQLLRPEITESVNDGVLYELLHTEIETLEEGKELLINSVTEVMEDGVRTENIQEAISEVEQTIQFSSFDAEMKSSLTELSHFVVAENSFFDAEKTSEARKKAASNVDPVVIRAGEVIVRQGQTISNEIYDELALVGALDSRQNKFPVIGLALIIFLVMLIMVYEIGIFEKNKDKDIDRSKLGAIFFIILISLLFMKAGSLYATSVNQLYFAVPVATGALLVKLLLTERLAIVQSMLIAILGSILYNGQIPGSLNVEAGIYFFFSQMAAVIFLGRATDRLAVLKAGIGMSVMNVLAILTFLFLSIEKYSLSDIFMQSGYGVIAAFLSTVLTFGLLPFFETGLGILSDYKLLALAKPNHPLLRKILTEAPGTYHHSIMVANLSETACESIGANGLLARVGAYYHDIGKTVRPQYFIENQMTDNNPHDTIQPRESADIIISHPYDGADILKDHKFPQPIIDIAGQHHGSSLLKYFYFKEQDKNKHTKEEDFRYPGLKPQTKEAAVICICDAVEAAVRSLKEPTEKKIDELVASIVKERLMDGQLNECPLTLKDLDKVHQTICETLKGMFHSRIQYPIKEAK